jgi:hypothetical protein
MVPERVRSEETPLAQTQQTPAVLDYNDCQLPTALRSTIRGDFRHFVVIGLVS